MPRNKTFRKRNPKKIQKGGAFDMTVSSFPKSESTKSLKRDLKLYAERPLFRFNLSWDKISRSKPKAKISPWRNRFRP